MMVRPACFCQLPLRQSKLRPAVGAGRQHPPSAHARSLCGRLQARSCSDDFRSAGVPRDFPSWFRASRHAATLAIRNRRALRASRRPRRGPRTAPPWRTCRAHRACTSAGSAPNRTCLAIDTRSRAGRHSNRSSRERALCVVVPTPRRFHRTSPRGHSRVGRVPSPRSCASPDSRSHVEGDRRRQQRP